MNAIIKKYFRPVASAALAASFALAALPLAASAQAEDQEIQGTVQSINSTFNITVLDSNGNLDNVELHQGTVINPTGLTLAPGMNVTVDGYDDGGQFDANVIQTPYQYSGPAPVPVYYGAGWWYPGFAYGYGPSFSLFIGSGDGPYVYRQPWGGHWWVNTPVHTFVGVRGGGYAPGVRYPASRYVEPVRGNEGYGGARYPEATRYATPRTYSAPRSTYSAPRTYSAPSYSAPRSTYSAPRSTYSAPRSYSAPAARYGGGGYTGARSAPAAHYSAPAARSSGGGYRGGGSRGRNR